jgi:dihydroorotate dehydrogenase
MTNLQTKEAIDNAIRHFTELHEAKNQIIINHLEMIDAKLTKQNGSVAETIKRVSSLETDHARREIICPHRETILQLQRHKTELSAIKKYVRNWVLIATGIVNFLIGLIMYYLTN